MKLINAGANPWEKGQAVGETPNEKLLRIARGVARDRAQPRVKLLPPSSGARVDVSVGVGLCTDGSRKRSVEEMMMSGSSGGSNHNGNTASLLSLPPGITTIEQLGSVVNLSRLPAAFVSALKAQIGEQQEQMVISGGSSSNAVMNRSSNSNSNNTSNNSSSSQHFSSSVNKSENNTSAGSNVGVFVGRVEKSKPEKNKKKFAPRPPAGPPPPSAFENMKSNDRK